MSYIFKMVYVIEAINNIIFKPLSIVVKLNPKVKEFIAANLIS